MDPNHVTITGNLTRDPELRFTASGLATLTVGVAYNRRVKDDAGQWGDGPPSFFNVTCWRELAENVAESCHRGDKVTVSGRLEQRSWEKDGEKKSSVDVVADDVAVSLQRATVTVARNQRVTVEQGEVPRDAVAYDEPF